MQLSDLAKKNPEKAQQMVQQMTKLLEYVNYQPMRSNPDYDSSKFFDGMREYNRVQAKKEN